MAVLRRLHYGRVAGWKVWRGLPWHPTKREPPGEVQAGPHLVGVPEPHGATQGQLPHEQVVHPAEGELQVPHLVLV